MLQLCGQEVLLSWNPSRSRGHLSHTRLSTREQGERQSCQGKKEESLIVTEEEEDDDDKNTRLQPSSLTCCFLKHPPHTVHPPVLGQLLGGRVTLHPALLRLPQRFVHTLPPPVGSSGPVGRGLGLDRGVVVDLRTNQDQPQSEHKKTLVFRWICSLVRKLKQN